MTASTHLLIAAVLPNRNQDQSLTIFDYIFSLFISIKWTIQIEFKNGKHFFFFLGYNFKILKKPTKIKSNQIQSIKWPH